MDNQLFYRDKSHIMKSNNTTNLDWMTYTETQVHCNILIDLISQILSCMFMIEQQINGLSIVFLGVTISY